MKKTIFFILLFTIFTKVRAIKLETLPATLYYTAIKNDIYTYHLTSYYDMDRDKYIFRIPFHIDERERLFETNNTPFYRDENIIKVLTSEQIKTIERIIFWGKFYGKYGNNLRYFAAQIKIWQYLYPEYTIYLSSKGGEQLEYIDDYLNDLNNLLDNQLDCFDKLVLPLNTEHSILNNFSNFVFFEDENLTINYNNNILKLKANDLNASFKIKTIYDENNRSIFYNNIDNQFFIEENENIDFRKQYFLNVVDMSGDIKDISNPETGFNYTIWFVLIFPILLIILIPSIIIILYKSRIK